MLLRWFSRRDPDRVAASWLRDQQRSLMRIEYHGPSITLPIRRPDQQNSVWNSWALRRQARKDVA